MPKTISERFKVVDRDTGKEAVGVFVIDPVNDPSARAALIGYARAVEDSNWKLASDLRQLVDRIESKTRNDQQLISGSMEIPDWLINQQRDKDLKSNSTLNGDTLSGN